MTGTVQVLDSLYAANSRVIWAKEGRRVSTVERKKYAEVGQPGKGNQMGQPLVSGSGDVQSNSVKKVEAGRLAPCRTRKML